MELIVLKPHGRGYRGCAIEAQGYLFFQYSRKRGLKILKRYARQEFTGAADFMAVMRKFITPPAFLQPPVPIKALTGEELDRTYGEIIRKQ